MKKIVVIFLLGLLVNNISGQQHDTPGQSNKTQANNKDVDSTHKSGLKKNGTSLKAEGGNSTLQNNSTLVPKTEGVDAGSPAINAGSKNNANLTENNSTSVTKTKGVVAGSPANVGSKNNVTPKKAVGTNASTQVVLKNVTSTKTSDNGVSGTTNVSSKKKESSRKAGSDEKEKVPTADTKNLTTKSTAKNGETTKKYRPATQSTGSVTMMKSDKTTKKNRTPTQSSAKVKTTTRNDEKAKALPTTKKMKAPPAEKDIPATKKTEAPPAVISIPATKKTEAPPAVISIPATKKTEAPPAVISIPATKKTEAPPAVISIPATKKTEAPLAVINTPATKNRETLPTTQSTKEVTIIKNVPPPTEAYVATPSGGEVIGTKEEVEVVEVENPPLTANGGSEEASSSNFPVLFLFSILAIVGGYFLYHNKSKLLGLIIEGRSPRSSPRYNRLKNVEEAMPGMRSTKHV